MNFGKVTLAHRRLTLLEASGADQFGDDLNTVLPTPDGPGTDSGLLIWTARYYRVEAMPQPFRKVKTCLIKPSWLIERGVFCRAARAWCRAD